MRWNDVEEICEILSRTQPVADLRGMSEAEIVELVRKLPGFEGELNGFNAGHIEAIRAGAWWGA